MIALENEENKARSGCLKLALLLGGRFLSALLLSAGAILLVYGVWSLQPSPEVRTILPILVAPFAAYFLLRIGRGILRDLRNPGSSEDYEKNEHE